MHKCITCVSVPNLFFKISWILCRAEFRWLISLSFISLTTHIIKLIKLYEFCSYLLVYEKMVLVFFFFAVHKPGLRLVLVKKCKLANQISPLLFMASCVRAFVCVQKSMDAHDAMRTLNCHASYYHHCTETIATEPKKLNILLDCCCCCVRLIYTLNPL